MSDDAFNAMVAKAQEKIPGFDWTTMDARSYQDDGTHCSYWHSDTEVATNEDIDADKYDWGVACAMRELCLGCDGVCTWSWLHDGETMDDAQCRCKPNTTTVVKEAIDADDYEWIGRCAMQELCYPCEGTCSWSFLKASETEDDAQCRC